MKKYQKCSLQENLPKPKGGKRESLKERTRYKDEEEREKRGSVNQVKIFQLLLPLCKK